MYFNVYKLLYNQIHILNLYNLKIVSNKININLLIWNIFI